MNLSEEIETQVADLLLDRLKHHNISVARAREIAKHVLQMIPEHLTNDDMRKIIPRLDDNFAELAEIVHSYLGKTDEKMKAEVIPQIRTIITKLKNDS